MGHEFTSTDDIEVPASVEDVWTAIATGPGIDSWFMGRNEVANGQVKMAFGGYGPTSDITASEPLRHFAYDTGKAPTAGSSPTSSSSRAATTAAPCCGW